MKLILATLLLIFLHSASYGEQITEVYDTYLPANKLIPILEPLLGPNDKITGYHNKLFVKASPSAQDELLRVLQEIDRPLKNIQISMRYADSKSLEAQSNSGTVTIYRGSSRSSGVDVEVVNKNRMSTHVDSADSQIRVLEGEQGVLDVGQEVPIEQVVFLGPWQTGTQKQYKSIGNQLYVIPRLVKDKIRVEVFTSNQRMKQKGDKSIKKMDAETVLLLEPGEWAPLAGSSRSSNQLSNAGNLSTRHADDTEKSLQIRADILN